MSTSVLKTDCGKFLMIQKINDTLTLCAEEVQNEVEKAPLVVILTNALEQKAYKFHYENKLYWVKADASKLEVVKDGETTSGPFWFERDQQGSEKYRLGFTHMSKRFYISSKPDDGIDVLTVTNNPDASLLITHEQRNASSVSF